MTKKELWIRLKRYRFQNLVPVSLAHRIKGAFGSTDAFTRAFAAKVAKKHGWTEEYAFLAVREYKKFIFLGVTSHYEVTPSAVIDKVWHEHNLFTKGYREFCEDVLEQYFDHSPELIPFDDQNELFNAQYRKTLAFYEHEFGTKPPEEIWGKSKFDPTMVKRVIEKPPRKQGHARRRESYEADEDTPLFSMFSSDTDAPYAPIPVTFSGHGGMFGGGGASGSWSESQTRHSTPNIESHSVPESHSETTNCSSSSNCGGAGD